MQGPLQSTRIVEAMSRLLVFVKIIECSFQLRIFTIHTFTLKNIRYVYIHVSSEISLHINNDVRMLLSMTTSLYG